MYSKLPHLVLGFHGCDESVFHKVIHEHKPLNRSNNSYDWLGNGIYFWENSYERALEWATSKSKQKGSKLKTPAVIGAVLDLGYCLNLLDYHSIEILQRGYLLLETKTKLTDKPLPKNRNIKGNTDLLMRDLDCAVIQQIHEYNVESNLPPYDSVRGAFIEGCEIYPGSGFKEKTHIQLCITNPNCIKGYFKPLSPCDGFQMP